MVRILAQLRIFREKKLVEPGSFQGQLTRNRNGNNLEFQVASDINDNSIQHEHATGVVNSAQSVGLRFCGSLFASNKHLF